MLATDAKKLRFLGMDMRSRVRRRWAVVGMYAAYYAAMGWCREGHGWLTPERGMWTVSIATIFLGLFRENGLVKPFGEPPVADLDEREVVERNKASHWTLSVVAGLLLAYAMEKVPEGRVKIVSAFLTMAVLAMTLPKAFVLWREPDPGESEMKLIRSQV